MRLRLALLLTFLPSASFAAAMPTRVVSMNLCADELVLRLADRAQVGESLGLPAIRAGRWWRTGPRACR